MPGGKHKTIGTALLCAVAVNLILFFIKLYIGLSASCLSIYSDAINNLSDTLACSLSVLSLYLAAKQADERYPDGYGKAEDIAGFLLAVLLCVTGGYLGYTALERILYPRPVNFLFRQALLLTATVPVKLLLGFAMRKVNKKYHSVLSEAIGADSFADCFVTGMAILSFVLSRTDGMRIDGIFGLAGGVLIAGNGIRLAVSSAKRLLGENDIALRKQTESILREDDIIPLQIRMYRTGAVCTLVCTIESGTVSAATVRKVKEQTGADLYYQTNGGNSNG